MGGVGFFAFRQLWGRKLLNGIAVLGVVFGVLTLITVRGMMNGFKVKFLENVLKISPHVVIRDEALGEPPDMLTEWAGGPIVARVSHRTPPSRQLAIRRPTEIVRALEQTPGIRAASASVGGPAFAVFGVKKVPIDVRGIEPGAQEQVTPISGYVGTGRYDALGASGEGILLGAGVADRLGAGVGDVVTLNSPEGTPIGLKVVGIFDAGIPPIDNTRVYTTVRVAQVALGRGNGVNRIEIRLDDTDRAPAVAAEIQRSYGYSATSWQEANANSLTILRQQDTIIAFVITAILAVGGFGILAVQLMIVIQKRRDIAILRSIGFTRRDVMAAFLLQGGAIALVGGIIGDVSGHLLLRALGTLKTPAEGLIKTDHFLVHDDPRMYPYGILFALVVGLVASAGPASRAARVEPVDVLRGQT